MWGDKEKLECWCLFPATEKLHTLVRLDIFSPTAINVEIELDYSWVVFLFCFVGGRGF